MDRLFKDKVVPDISDWDVTQVTSMREMFMGTTKPDTSEWTFHPDVDKFWWEKDVVTCPPFIGANVSGRCQFTNSGLRNIVLAWETDEGGTKDLYGPLATWDVSYVTNMTDLFQDPTKVPDITNWDMSNVVHADRMLLNSGFTQRIDNKDLSSLQTANDMMPTNYGGHLCGKHFLRVCEALVRKYKALGDTDALKDIDCANRVGFNGMGLCLTSTVPEGESASVIKQAVNHYYGTDAQNAAIIDRHGEMSEWDVSQVQNMRGLFINNRNGIPPLAKWDTSSVTDMQSMFENSDFNEDIRHWDVRKVDNFNFMFRGNEDFAVSLTEWEIHASANAETFSGNTHYDGLMFKIDTILPEPLTDATFQDAVDQYFVGYRSVNKICTKGNMYSLVASSAAGCFALCNGARTVIVTGGCYCVTSEADLTSTECQAASGGHTIDDVYYAIWEKSDPAADSTSSPTRIYTKNNPYGEISDWLVYEVTDMSNAFKGKTTFNEDISEWNVGAVTDMSSMFEGSAFNSPIGKWNVDKVRDMSSMFKGSSFNQLIDRWNVSSVEDMSSMFENSDFSRPIGDWDLWGTYWDIVQVPDGNNSKCFAEEGMIITLDPNTRQNLQSNYRLCFDKCTGSYPIRLDDIEGRNRDRGGGEVGSHYTPYMAGFAFVEDASLAYTCQCATEIEECDSSPFDRVLEYRDMKTDNMFTNNDKFIQPLCGIGWRYRDIKSLNPPQRGVSLTCGICNAREHMSTCGLCLGEFRFDHCLDSPMAFTLKELHDFGGSHGMTGLVVDADGIPLVDGSDDDILNGYVNPYACNCEYEEGMKGCLVVNGRKQVRMKEWYADGLTSFTDNKQYYCELDYLNNARSVASAEGFNSVECTEDTLLTQIECGLVGGNWNGKCDKCLKPCDPPELGVKFISEDRRCEKCPEGQTVWNNECVWCPDGKFTDENRAWCGKCPSGTYGADGDCFSCAQGAASTFEGALQCSTCSAGTFSVGTGCQDCPTGKSSQNGAWSCYDVAHCRHGETNTTITDAGNWCDLCNIGFEKVDGTCVADCVYGDFTVQNGVGTCLCTDMWGQTLGKTWNDCDYCDPKYVHIGETCHATPCDDTHFTDCVCGVSPVTGAGLCYDNKPYFECSLTLTENCLCNTDDGYTHVGVGFRCIDSQVVKLCGSDAISKKGGCSDLKIGGNCLDKCAHGDQIVDSATHVVLSNTILPLCGGETKTGCYGVPWKEMDYNCGAHVECEVNYLVNTGVTYTGMGNEDASTCCEEKEQCRDYECPATYADRVSDYVLTRTEGGMCNGGEWYFQFGIAVFYTTVADTLEACGTDTGESIIAQLGGKGFVCAQGFSNEIANYAPTLQHKEDCDTWYSTLRFDGTDHNATTYTYQSITSQDTYSTGLVFTPTEDDDTCCTEVCDGQHTCTRPIYGVCDGVCDAADFSTGGDQPSTCCEADSWYCDSTCNVGFTNSGAYCGEKCDTTHFAATSITQNVPVELSGVEVVCNKTLKTASTKEGCSSACSGYFQMDGGKCYCTDTGPCKSDTAADCSDWCDGSLQRAGKQFGYGEYNTYTVCRDLKSGASCPSGWFSDSRWDNACAYGSLGDPNSQACYDSNNCCEVSHITYQMRTLPERTESVCCDIDTAYQACARLDCPDRHTKKTIYDTGFYSTDHTTDCCEPISETHYCDTHDSGGDFVCTIGRLQYDNVFCDEECNEDNCCKPNEQFCGNCVDDDVPTGLYYCGNECADACCKSPPKCDTSYDCGSNVEINWNYICTNTTDGECAPSEYEDGKCCTTNLSPYCSADSRYDTSGAPSVSEISYAGDPMPGCNKSGYISYYEVWGRTGVSFTDESFEGVCCNYVEACPSDHQCAPDTHPKGGYSDSVARHCVPGYKSGWDRIQNCPDYSMCCEEETCGTAQDRLGTQCYNSDWDKWDIVQPKQFNRSTFFETCCKSTCQQLQYEKAEGDRGHDLCDNSLNGEDVDVDLANTMDIVGKCCENSCGKEATSNGWSCPTGTDKDPGYWTNYDYGFYNAMSIYVSSISDQTDFKSKCCYTSCNAVNRTSTCVGVENIKTWDHSNQDMYSIWYQARVPIVNFETTCCIDATCNNIVKQDNFRGNSCEDTYPGTYYNSQNDNTVLTDPSDPLPCCGGVASACKAVMDLGSRCGTGKTYASWVSSSITVTSDNFENSCCSFKCATENVDCGNLFPGSSWSNTHSMSNYDMRTAVCCGTEWQCDVYPDYKGWGSYYTSRDVNGITYKAPNPVTAFSSEGGTVNVYARFLKYNESVTESGWAEKCHCPENDLDCLSDKITSSLTTTCQGKENSQGFTCDSVCASSSLNTCTNWLNIAEYGTKVWTGQITRTDYYAKNRFMMNCCVEGADWVWDSSTNFRN